MPRRTRFYHAKIDARSLKSGENYHSLKNVTVILITPFDPFGLNRMVYTIRNGCAEAPEMAYEDGARTMYLYTKGTEGNPPEELSQLLHYMENTIIENAGTDALQSIDRMVRTVKKDGEVSSEYMKIFEREEMLIRQGIQQGQELERQNTEREKKRADEAEYRATKAEKELEELRKKFETLKAD
ncbi:MAG: hypothetical protein SOX32_01930 [Candidatus Choladocola sp.]|nr:hypothetical protein [Candidatus Choladocola sp.]